jgi:hypothetical protein
MAREGKGATTQDAQGFLLTSNEGRGHFKEVFGINQSDHIGVAG